MDSEISNIFDQIDINNHKYLTLHQFFNFISKTFQIWEPLYLFRVNLIKMMFKKDEFIDILERRLNIVNIKQKIATSNKYEPESCMTFIKRIIKRKPHKSHFDYDCDGVLSFSSLTLLFIRKYIPDFIIKPETFAMKHLGQYKEFILISEIDKYYIKYRQINPHRMYSVRKRSQHPSQCLDLSSRSSSITQSILRVGTRSFANLDDKVPTPTAQINHKRHLTAPSHSIQKAIIVNQRHATITITQPTDQTKLDKKTSLEPTIQKNSFSLNMSSNQPKTSLILLDKGIPENSNISEKTVTESSKTTSPDELDM